MPATRRHPRLLRILLLFLALAVMLPAVAPTGGGVSAATHADCPLDCPGSVPNGCESPHCAGCLPANAAMLPHQFLALAPRTARDTLHARRGDALLPGHYPPQLRPPSV